MWIVSIRILYTALTVQIGAAIIVPYQGDPPFAPLLQQRRQRVKVHRFQYHFPVAPDVAHGKTRENEITVSAQVLGQAVDVGRDSRGAPSLGGHHVDLHVYAAVAAVRSLWTHRLRPLG